jgi:hypothetical protein
MEARLEEDKPASEDMTPGVAHEQEVPLEDAIVMPVGEPRKRRRDQHLAAQGRQKKEEQDLDARHRGKQQDLVAVRRAMTRRAQVKRHNFLSTKDMTREYRESRKDLAATGREETRHAKVAQHKGNFVGRNRHKEVAT